jgi:CRP-like cAMP-binding protein
MYFIAHGEVEVIAGGHRVAYLGEGAMIGEIAMAMKTRRTATVRTVTFTVGGLYQAE